MNMIFNGFLMVFLDFNIDIGASRIGLIPDFIGYLLVLRGLREMAAYHPRFVRVRPWATGMAVYTGILYLMDLLGVSAGLGALVTLPLGLLSVAVSLKISLEIVRGIEDMETASGRDLHAASLRLVWIWMAVASFASVALLYIAPALSLVSMLLGMAANIVFLFSFHKSKNLFEEFRDRIPTRNPD